MSGMGFTGFDLIVIGVMALSMLLSFFRGLVREVLALISWVGASAFTVYAFPMVAEHIRPYTGSQTVATGIATVGTFVFALLVLSLINAAILRMVKTGSNVGMFDNILGLLFGALRGAFIVSLTYLLLTLVFAKDHYPNWLEKARTKPYAEAGADILRKAAPEDLGEDSKLGEKLSDMGKKGADGKAHEGYKAPDGYRDNDMNQLNRLIDATRSKDN